MMRRPLPRNPRRVRWTGGFWLTWPCLAILACGILPDAEVPQGSDGHEGSGPGVRTQAEAAADWDILEEKLTWAYARRLDTLPIGDVMVEIGRTFVGTPYLPHTLEIPGPEQLVINLQALDCVTFVENVLALSRLVRSEPPSVLDEPDVYRARYRDLLTTIRYRHGRIDGYASRLHYFSDWIADGEGKGLLEDMDEDLGAVPDGTRIDFMSTHPQAYAQLADTGTLARIVGVEDSINRRARLYVPEDRIGEVAPHVANGDVIAATSTVEGLDVAHTGIALWIDGELHLMHAPLVGEAVQISERPLAGRIQDIGGQDGIMVARPLDPGARP